jgi:hypothetical protein
VSKKTLSLAQLSTEATLSVTGVDGAVKEYTLVLDFDAVRAIIDQTATSDKPGIDIADAPQFFAANSLQVLVIACCALKRHHPDMTVDKVRELVPPGNIWPLRNLMAELMWPGIADKIIRPASGDAAASNPQ